VACLPALLAAMRRCGIVLGFCVPVALAALGWATLPTASSPGETLQSHARLVMHLLGLLPPDRKPDYGRVSPAAPRAANGTIKEVEGFVGPETFKENYLWKEPVVFRGGATKEFGFDMDCLKEGGRSPERGLIEEMGDRKVRIFKDQNDDASVELMTMQEYDQLLNEAKANGTKATPYPRAIPQNYMQKCRPVDNDRINQYRGWVGKAYQRYVPEPDLSVIFASYTEGTSTKMHIDIGDSFFTQVHGRKRWLLVDPEYVSHMKIWGDTLNLVYISGFDVHREALPQEVPLKEVILHPGDVLYFPAMTFHAVYNLDPVTIGVDNAVFDAPGCFYRHWLLSAMTVFNPWTVVKAISIFIRKGTFCVTDLYFDGFSRGAATNENSN